jgi:hypothetical protein
MEVRTVSTAARIVRIRRSPLRDKRNRQSRHLKLADPHPRRSATLFHKLPYRLVNFVTLIAVG